MVGDPLPGGTLSCALSGRECGIMGRVQVLGSSLSSLVCLLGGFGQGWNPAPAPMSTPRV